ncbi:Uncharacterised protein [Leminorella richardii]|uniref:Uncharacterized protein n=2 Tax=Leminorella richardii TaxID=158841 RepID=A0A2X4USF0_9GAMM|nr:Uncharacterised protein [Leminorella richardii]
MTTQKNLTIGITIIVISCFLLWSASLFQSYVYSRIHVSRDLLLTIFWLLPASASFLAYFRRARAPLLISLGYTLLLSVLMSLVHLIQGEIGVAIDFSGIDGLKVIGGVYFFISAVSIGAGGVVGALARPALKGR